jgi:5-methyltetrahydrofolate--homocysteine methyltransferase
MDRLFEGLDELPGARQLVAATVAAELCGRLYAGGVRHFHFYTLNRAELSYAICHLLGLRPKDERAHDRAPKLRAAEAARRILIKDGAYGTEIQAEGCRGEAYCAGSTSARRHDQKGNNDLLNLTRPEIVRGSARASRRRRRHARDQHLQRQPDQPGRLRRRTSGARDQPSPRRGSRARSPTSGGERTAPPLRRRRDRADQQDAVAVARRQRPRLREVDFDTVKAVYREQIDALVEGGVDFILVETVFDTLNAKAAIMARSRPKRRSGRELPLMISMT